MQHAHTAVVEPKRSLWATVLIGLGLMAALDEIIFHQLLNWHHFYDQSTLSIGLLTDGLLHGSELAAFFAGGYLLAKQIKQQTLAPTWAWAGLFFGMGSFQLFDGIINHKVLRLHQIRYGVDNMLPYDLAWNGAGFVLLLIGTVILLRTRQHTT